MAENVLCGIWLHSQLSNNIFNTTIARERNSLSICVVSIVRISTDPFDVRAIVSVDGDIIGIAPLNMSMSNTNPHEIVIAAEGYDTYTETVSLSRDGGVKNVVAKLTV